MTKAWTVKLIVAIAVLAGLSFTAFRDDASAAGGNTSFLYSGNGEQTKTFFTAGFASDGEVCLIDDPFNGCAVDVDFIPGAISVSLTAEATTKATVNANTNFTVSKPGGIIQQDTDVTVTSTNVAVDGPKKEYKLETKPALVLRIDWDEDEDGFQCTDFLSDVDDDFCFIHSFDAGFFTLHDREFIPLYAGASQGFHDQKDFSLPICQIIGTAVPVLAFLDNLCRLKLIGNADSTLTATDGFHATRTITANNDDLLSGPLSWPSPAAVTDTFSIPCEAPVGAEVRYKIEDNQYDVKVDPATVGATLVLNIGGELLGIDFSFDIDLFEFDVDLLNEALNIDAPNGGFEVSLGTVAAEKQPPEVKNIDVSEDPLKGKPVTFEVTANDNCNTADQLHYKWQFDDGGVAFGRVAAHTFAETGFHTGEVRVFDKRGNMTARNFSLVVGVNPDTNIKYEGPIGVGPNNPDPLEFSARLLDHDGRPIKGRELQFAIVDEGGTVVAEASNTTDVNGRARVMLRAPETEGAYKIAVTFKGDDTYDGSEFSKSFTVFDNRPPAVSPLPEGIKAPWGVPIEFSGFATDPDGSAQDTLKYVWDFGDGSPVVINQKVTHAFPRPGQYDVTLTVTDKDGALSEVRTVVLINKRPTTLKNCGATQVFESARKVDLCARLLVADIDGGDAEAGIKGKELQFAIAVTKAVRGLSDANGESRPSLNIILSQGCYPGRIEFKGDDLYEATRYDYVFYTTGGNRPGQVCSLANGTAGFALLDSDGDGCSNGQEAGPSLRLGGDRDPNNHFDFFDTPSLDTRDKAVTAADLASLVGRFGSFGDRSADPLSPPDPAPSYHPAFDRRPDGFGPDGAITAQDLAALVAQFGHTCA